MGLAFSFFGLLLALAKGDSSATNLNEFDTYNGDKCRRIRKPWSTLSEDDKQRYLNAVLLLREQGQGQMDLDELVAVGSVHMDNEGENQHMASTYFFWHGYLLWELESRIRNLGGEYECFGMPYWDFSGDPMGIFTDRFGGNGNPDDYWTVNGYSWEYTTKQYWVPAHCDAEGDHYPLCSLKRCIKEVHKNKPTISSAAVGDLIINSPNFRDFSEGYSKKVGIPRNLLTDTEYLYFPVVTSYDPIWYLFHSMVSYHQAIWTDCHDYDQIEPEALEHNSNAYTAFCTEGRECGDMGLDAAMVFNGLLPEKEWSFIHDNDLTARMSYHFPRWNIQYDLEHGSGFYFDSGMNEFCKGKLNPEWFKLNPKNGADDKVLDSVTSIGMSVSSSTLSIVAFIVLMIGLLAYFVLQTKSSKKALIANESCDTAYGAI